MATTFASPTTVPVAAGFDDPWREPAPLCQVLVGALVGLALIATSLAAWVALAFAVLHLAG